MCGSCRQNIIYPVSDTQYKLWISKRLRCPLQNGLDIGNTPQPHPPGALSPPAGRIIVHIIFLEGSSVRIRLVAFRIITGANIRPNVLRVLYCLPSPTNYSRSTGVGVRPDPEYVLPTHSYGLAEFVRFSPRKDPASTPCRPPGVT